MTKEELAKIEKELTEKIDYHAYFVGNSEAIKAKRFILNMINEYFQETREVLRE